jgi:phenylacetate-coenzyme A ligase PaaK-like adenylate-forming protein
MPEFLLSAPAAGFGRVRVLLSRLASVPGLGDRYQGLTAESLDELAKVPVMLKTELQQAIAHLQPRAEHGATWIFQSGGSTGSPQVGHAPTGLYMAEVYEHWKALTPDDVFVNGWSAGKMWGAHFLVNAYADHAGCFAMNLGAIAKAEYDPWLEFFANRKVTAFGGTPSVLRLVFGHARQAGVKLPDLRKVLWLGEAWDPQLDEDLAAVAPQARRWGMFGSTETWVAGVNTPGCAADTWHPLPSHLIGVDDDEMLDFTSLNPQALNPVLRYRTGDAGRIVTCSCGREKALQVLGRRDGLVKFRGHLVNVDDFVTDIGSLPGVERAQLAQSDDVLEVLVLGDAPGLAERVRDHILGSAFGPSIVFQRNPDTLKVTVVQALLGNDRTGKIPNLVRR